MSLADVEAERRMAGVLAAFLDQGRRIDGLSRLLTGAAMIVLMVLPLTTGLRFDLPLAIALLVAVIGLAEIWFSVRVGFDAALFRALAGSFDLAGVDAALQGLGLLPTAKAGRSLGQRALGARSLLYTQSMLLGAQAVLILAGAAIVAALVGGK
jgi:hypothetical protein